MSKVRVRVANASVKKTGSPPSPVAAGMFYSLGAAGAAVGAVLAGPVVAVMALAAGGVAGTVCLIDESTEEASTQNMEVEVKVPNQSRRRGGRRRHHNRRRQFESRQRRNLPPPSGKIVVDRAELKRLGIDPDRATQEQLLEFARLKGFV